MVRLRRHVNIADADIIGYCNNCRYSQLVDQPDYDDRVTFLCERFSMYSSGQKPCKRWRPRRPLENLI